MSSPASALPLLRRRLVAALLTVAAGFLLNLSVFQLIENTHLVDRAPFTSGYRVDLLDLALCAVALGLALWARGQFLKAAGTARLPRDEHLLWLGTLVLVAGKLLTAVWVRFPL
ncbi:hypothetical protein [Deinococcus arcticus]|uniref:Uncharacterized protein n=1 Tax=Deinococcus arcticus TaxID=2136176 RepID=A0A2T3WAC8_9DEIO|nr:hypothetical protein [Deinococcus arcticus]PTA68859.1 hypothetical protein C8263_06460 [Deinococcus arcticus]